MQLDHLEASNMTVPLAAAWVERKRRAVGKCWKGSGELKDKTLRFLASRSAKSQEELVY